MNAQGEPSVSATVRTVTPPLHEEKSFQDPVAEQHGWAAVLRPEFVRNVLPDETLTERLIEVVGDTHQKMQQKGEFTRFCIVGSRVLQRILSTRYLASNEKIDRVFYPVEDIDVTVANEDALQELSQELHDQFQKEYDLKLTENYVYIAGLHIYPLRFFNKNDKLNDNSRHRAKIDLSVPLPGPQETPDPANPGQTKPSVFARIGEKYAKVIDGAKYLPMAQVDDRMVSAPALSDMAYLDSLEEALNEERLHPENMLKRTDIKQTSQDKIRQNILPLLLHMEATRKMAKVWWNPDEFSIRLLGLCFTHIPERVKTLLEQLEKNVPKKAKQLRQVLGLPEPVKTPVSHIPQAPPEQTPEPPTPAPLTRPFSPVEPFSKSPHRERLNTRCHYLRSISGGALSTYQYIYP